MRLKWLIKEFIVKEVVRTAGPNSITLEFIEVGVMTEEERREYGELIETEPEAAMEVFHGATMPERFLTDETSPPEVPNRFFCIVQGKKGPARALMNQRGQTRFFSPNAAISLMKELLQDQATFTAATSSRAINARKSNFL